MPFDRSMSDTAKNEAELDARTMGILIERVAADRDRDAFVLLFRHFAPRLKSYLMRLGAGAEPAEELAQEAMIMVWRKAHTFDAAQASASTWIFRIARNKRIDALRRESRPELDASDPMLVPEQPEEADKVVEATQEEGRLRRALKVLPPEQAEIVRLAYFEDQAHSSIADSTGLPLGTVKSRLRLALARLRTVLQEEDL